MEGCCVTLPALVSVAEVRARLNVIFPAEFPDRGILVGVLAARVVFVALYGAFITGTKSYFRPGTVLNFSDRQAALVDPAERMAWKAVCNTGRFQPLGHPWYRVGSREPLRDDLLRNRLIPLGVATRRDGYPINSPVPIYSISAEFAALFEPTLSGSALVTKIEEWRAKHLDRMTLKRIALLTSGIRNRKGQVVVTLPTTGQQLRLAAGEASVITRDVCEIMATAMFSEPVVVHVSHSDKKTQPELTAAAIALGLEFDMKAELPDVVIAETKERLLVVFVEVVHSDGAITEVRAKALMRIAAEAGIAADSVMLITAFEDRTAAAFKKRVSELAIGSRVWFRCEPYMLMTLEQLAGLES